MTNKELKEQLKELQKIRKEIEKSTDLSVKSELYEEMAQSDIDKASAAAKKLGTNLSDSNEDDVECCFRIIKEVWLASY